MSHTVFSPNFNVPAGQPGANQLRSFGAIPQTLAANNVPAVSATTGLGTGGGASVQPGQTNGSQGYVEVLAGSNPSTGGTVALTFPNTPPTLFIAASDGFGTLSQGAVGNVVTLTWTAKIQASKRHRIAYQWSVNQ